MNVFINQDSQYILNSLITEVSDVVWVKNLDGIYILINEAGARFFKKDRNEIIGKTDSELFSEETITKIRASDIQVIESGQSLTIEDTLLTLDGQKRTFLAVKSVYRDDENKIRGVLGIIRDITERKQMEEDLRLAKEIAEEANRKKEEFLANISHELRTPLHNIITSSQIALAGIIGKLNEKTIEYFDLIAKSGTHLLTLIDDLLDISKINAGKFTITITTIPTHVYLSETLTLVSPLFESKNQSITLHITDNIPSTFEGDAIRLKQALCNLLSNAYKFSPVDTLIQISCSYESSTDNIIFSVQDQGPGIEDKDFERILHPFEQGYSSQNEYIKGTGLGLALVKSIIELHHGTLQIDSTLGEGSTFTIKIPTTQTLNTQIQE